MVVVARSAALVVYAALPKMRPVVAYASVKKFLAADVRSAALAVLRGTVAAAVLDGTGAQPLLCSHILVSSLIRLCLCSKETPEDLNPSSLSVTECAE